MLIPPFRYGLLASSPFASSSSDYSIHRGSIAKPKNIPFLSTLGLKTIISITSSTLEDYEAEHSTLLGPDGETVSKWAKSNGIRLIHVQVADWTGEKRKGVPINAAQVKEVIELLINKTNLPCYLHNLDGSDSVSIVGACLRKLMGWSEVSYTREIARYLRLLPVSPDHLSFIRSFFSSSNRNPVLSSEFILVPPSKTRSPWLWPSGMPTKLPTLPSLDSLQLDSLNLDLDKEVVAKHINMNVLVDDSQGEEEERINSGLARKKIILEANSRKDRSNSTISGGSSEMKGIEKVRNGSSTPRDRYRPLSTASTAGSENSSLSYSTYSVDGNYLNGQEVNIRLARESSRNGDEPFQNVADVETGLKKLPDLFYELGTGMIPPSVEVEEENEEEKEEKVVLIESRIPEVRGRRYKRREKREQSLIAMDKERSEAV